MHAAQNETINGFWRETHHYTSSSCPREPLGEGSTVAVKGTFGIHHNDNGTTVRGSTTVPTTSNVDKASNSHVPSAGEN